MRRIANTPFPLVVLEPPDSGTLHAYYRENREHLAPWEPHRDPSFYTPEQVRKLVADRYREYRDGTSVHLSVLDDGGKMVAECNFTNIVRGPFQACTLGFSVAAACAGKGIMTGVVRQATETVFAEYGLHRIMANYMPRNAARSLRRRSFAPAKLPTRPSGRASARVLEKCGFVREGFAKQYLRIAGRWEDHVLTALVNPAAFEP